MAKQSEDSNNNSNLKANSTSDYAGEIIMYSGQKLTITTGNPKFELIEFLGLGKVIYDGTDSFQVETIKIGDKLIDAINYKKIHCIERRANVLEIDVYDNSIDFYHIYKHEVEHCESVVTAAGAYDDHNAENC